MRQVSVILWAKLRMAAHAVASIRNESKLKVGVVSISAVLLWLAAFALFSAGFGWVRRFGEGLTGGAGSLNIGEIIMARLLSVFALTLFFLLIFSNVLIAYSTIYRSREVTYLVQSPLPTRPFFIVRFIECVWFSSWASAFLGSPLILAYGREMGANPMFYAAAAAFYLPYVTLPAALGAIITLLLVRVFPRLKRASIITVAATALLALFFLLRQRFSAIRLSEDAAFTAILDTMAQTQSPWLPSYWAAEGVLAAASGRHGTALFNFGLLLSNALMLTWLAAGLAGRVFYPGWSFLMGQDQQRIRPMGKGILGRLDRWFQFLRNPQRALVIKDLKLFWRDPAQWSQFVIFFGLMALYIANLGNRPQYAEIDIWRAWIASLNSGACMLILATLTSRFVFPLISLEGRRFWIVGLAPLTCRQLIWQKFWLSFVSTTAFTLGLAILSCYKLGVEPIAFFLCVYCVLAANFGLAGLAVGLGAIYPNFQEDNPARIVSGMGGTLNFLLSMAYITLIVAAQTLLFQWRVVERISQWGSYNVAVAVTVAFVTVLSALCVFAPIALGRRRLGAMEY